MSNESVSTEDIVNMNYRLMLMLGYASALIFSYRSTPQAAADDEKIAWFMKAVENVFYLKKPLPPMP